MGTYFVHELSIKMYYVTKRRQIKYCIGISNIRDKGDKIGEKLRCDVEHQATTSSGALHEHIEPGTSGMSTTYAQYDSYQHLCIAMLRRAT